MLLSGPRLDLHPLPLPVLQALLDGDLAAVLARLGFVRTGQQIDEVDGLELVLTADLRGFAESEGAPLRSPTEAARPPGGVA